MTPDIARLREVVDSIAGLNEIACSSATMMEYLSACSPVEHRCFSFLRDHGPALLSTLEAQAAELARVREDGWKLVPPQPTEAMADAFYRELGSPSDWFGMDEAYKAMLLAVPVPGGEDK